jgi:mono/diheme cytochrome c family protein
MRRALVLPAIGLCLIAATPTPFGGWAVITVEQLPEYLEAGRPVSLAFTVRHHGQVFMDDLEPTVTLRQKGEGRLRGPRAVSAVRGRGPGRYEATLTPGDTGDVRITIDANWHTAETTLLPIRVVPAGVVAEALPLGDRGRQLFVAKGCVSCHTKRDDRQTLGRTDVAIGPDLSGRAFPVEWLATKLADPARNRVRTNKDVVMPNLGLRDGEISALTSYINQRSAGGVAGR